MKTTKEFRRKCFLAYTQDWNIFIRDILGANLDKEQQKIVTAVQHNKLVSVRSGTARGKDFVAACISLAFFYLTPKWNDSGELVENTKVALTAPTDRQVKNIMIPEISRLFAYPKKKGISLAGEMVGYGIKTKYKEWFLTGFKASEHNHEAWSGFHAANTMFIVTEASGISENVYEAIEGNLQGNSRLLLVFNPNISVGYAAKSQKSDRWKKIRLNSLTAPNVLHKKTIHIGQVDYEWVVDKVKEWTTPVSAEEKTGNDFEFEGKWYRPRNIFKIKVLGDFPDVGDDSLFPLSWIEKANERWVDLKNKKEIEKQPRDIGVDIAGMGRDFTVFAVKHGNFVSSITTANNSEKRETVHMEVTGRIVNLLRTNKDYAFIDTIGEGAGVYSRLIELGKNNAISAKGSYHAKGLRDSTGQYTFANLRAYMYWSLRESLDPALGINIAIPIDDELTEEMTEIKWKFTSDGKILIEPKDDIIARLSRSPDKADSLALTFFPKIRIFTQTSNNKSKSKLGLF